jgi:hypothetical protein
MNAPVTSIDQIKSTVIDLAIRFGPKVLVAMLILFAGFMVARWVSHWLARALSRIELEPPVRSLLARIGWLLTFALFLVMALQNLGVELLPLIAGVGVAGAGLALATQGVLSNLVAGLSIIFAKPFRVGEYISIVGDGLVLRTIARPPARSTRPCWKLFAAAESSCRFRSARFGSLTADAAAKVSGQVPAQQPRFFGGGKEPGLRAASPWLGIVPRQSN